MPDLRTDIPYSGSDGRLTQAGWQALQGAISGATAGVTADIVALDARVDAIEAELAGSLVNLQAAVAAASQTSIDFTGVPSWVNRISVILNGLSLSGTAVLMVQLGDSGGIETAGYSGVAFTPSGSYANHSSGFLLSQQSVAANLWSGVITLNRISGNIWICAGNISAGTNYVGIPSGTKEVSATLDRVRVTSSNGTDTIDAGSVNISWE